MKKAACFASFNIVSTVFFRSGLKGVIYAAIFVKIALPRFPQALQQVEHALV